MQRHFRINYGIDFRRRNQKYQCICQYDAFPILCVPVCGNVIHSMGEAAVHCHGVLLKPAQAEQTDEKHKIFVERVEDGLFALDLVKGIDDREKSYDDTEKRRALEQAAKMLFG